MKVNNKAAARALETFEPKTIAGFFNETPAEWLLDVIPQMNSQRMSEAFEKMDPEVLVQLFESLEISHLVMSIRMMKEDHAASILDKLSEEKAASVKRLIHYLDHSIGAHMDPEVFTLLENLTVKEAISAIKKNKERVQPQLFVLNAERKLMGVLSLSDLITGNPGMEIKSMINTKITSLSPETPIQSVLSHREWQDFYALPVVDHTSMFLGAIRLENIRSILVRSGSKGDDMGQLTISALGELYRLGLAGLVRSATEIDALTQD
jgi:magnesium transporter